MICIKEGDGICQNFVPEFQFELFFPNLYSYELLFDNSLDKTWSLPYFVIMKDLRFKVQYARHYKPQLVCFLPHFQRPFLCF
jgi:hypothetical protein